MDKIDLVKKDIVKVKEFEEWLDTYIWEVEACMRTGNTELKKLKELAPEVLKAVVNYL